MYRRFFFLILSCFFLYLMHVIYNKKKRTSIEQFTIFRKIIEYTNHIDEKTYQNIIVCRNSVNVIIYNGNDNI